MKARLLKALDRLSETFWLLPAAMVLAALALATGLLELDHRGDLPAWLNDTDWLYNGGGTGARTLLGAIASSTIGVAGTVFSITIAGLSLAAGQMGPRLLRNFTRDRGVQITLGAFIGTFAYALMVLRSVRTQDEGLFTPHLAISIAMLLALACVGTLVYFVGHMATRINVDTVVELVSNDLRAAMKGLTTDQPSVKAPPAAFWADAKVVTDARRGYLQHLDEAALAQWASRHGTAVRLLVRRGDYVFPGAPMALLTVGVPGAQEALRQATALGIARGSDGDPEYAVRQLVEVAVRALSTGINDPHTAVSVLDRLGAALCDLAGTELPSGVTEHKGLPVLVVPTITYRGLLDASFDMIRQNAGASVSVYLRLLHVLTMLAITEKRVDRRAVLASHVERVWADASREVANSGDQEDVAHRYEQFKQVLVHGAVHTANFEDHADET